MAEYRIDTFLNALTNYLKAKAERDNTYAASKGGEWGYYGHREESRLDKAAKEVEESLLSIINAAGKLPHD